MPQLRIPRSAFVLALLLTAAVPARAQEPTPPSFGLGIEVVARTLLLEVLDEKGRPVAEVPAEALRLRENGVERPILEVRPRVAPPAGSETLSPLPVPPRVAALPPQRFVLLALDPVTLGRVAWESAIRDLSATADTFTAIGPVDVTVLSDPPVRLAAATRDPESVRAALARALVEVKPHNEFFGSRSRFIQEMERIFELRLSPLGSGTTPEGDEIRRRDVNQERVLQAEFAARELAVEERRLLDRSVGRLREAASAIARPLVAVWAAQGDPDTAGFVLSLLPGWVSNDDRIRFQGRPLGNASAFERIWEEIAADGVTLIPWSRDPEALLEISNTALSHSKASRPSLTLGAEWLSLFQVAAERTGGELVRSESELRTAIAQVGGRHELVYQSDDASEGWREIRIETTRPGWTVRTSPRLYVLAAAGRRAALDVPDLWVELAATSAAGPRPGRELVTLSALVDLSPLQRRLPAGTPLRFDVRYRATPPDGETLQRTVSLPVPALPAEGDLRYQVSLDVPEGTRGYALAVREETTGASGGSGPVAIHPGALEVEGADASKSNAAPAPDASSARVPPDAVRFFHSTSPPPGDPDLRLTWKKKELRLRGVDGGPGSSLEVGLALDGAERLRREREAFAAAAAGGVERLFGPADRVFRVDLGPAPSFAGAARGGPASLFARTPPALPTPTAVLDGIAFALDRFTGQSDRAVLIALTDGCGDTDLDRAVRVAGAARARAVPIVVVLVEGRPCPKPADRTPKRVTARETKARAQDEAEAAQRLQTAYRDLAARTGGLLLSLSEAEAAGAVWSEVEAALDRLRVARYEPSDAAVRPQEVELRTAEGELLRPGG